MAEISGSLRSRDAKSILWAGLFDVLYIHLNSFWARLHPYLLYNCTTHVLQSSTGVKVVKVVMLPPPLQFLFWLWTKLLRIPGVGTSHDGTSVAQIIGPKISQNLTVNRVNRVNRVNNIESSYIPNGRGSYPGFWHKNLRKGESDQKAGGSVFSPRPMYEYVYTYIYIICIYICVWYIYKYILCICIVYIYDVHYRLPSQGFKPFETHQSRLYRERGSTPREGSGSFCPHPRFRNQPLQAIETSRVPKNPPELSLTS